MVPAHSCSGPWPAGRVHHQTIDEPSRWLRGASAGAISLRWVGAIEPPAPGMGQRHRPPQPIRRKTPSALPALAVLALVLATLAILLMNRNHWGIPSRCGASCGSSEDLRTPLARQPSALDSLPHCPHPGSPRCHAQPQPLAHHRRALRRAGDQPLDGDCRRLRASAPRHRHRPLRHPCHRGGDPQG